MYNNDELEVFIFNYNGKDTVLPTIESLLNSEDVEVSICVIDDHSTDNSLEVILEHFPNVSFFQMPYNTKKLNVLRNKALELSKGEYVFICDNDLKFDKMCLSNLLKVMKSDDKIAACTPRLMHWDHPEIVYTAGTKLHYIGAAISEQRDKLYTEKDSISLNSGGGICLIRRSAAYKVGSFDEHFFMGWGDDGEFYQRLLIAGYKCLYIPSAFALHKDKLGNKNRDHRVLGQTYNRWVFMLSHYSAPLLLLLLPLLLEYEVLESAFDLISGFFLQHLKGDILILLNLPYVFSKRRFVQKIRTASDKEVLTSGNLYISPNLVEKHKFIKKCLSLFNSELNFYWNAIQKVIP